MRRHVSTRYTVYPATRVFAWNHDGTSNDEYWNYCVNEGRPTYVLHGNAYCWQPGFSYHEVKFKK